MCIGAVSMPWSPPYLATMDFGKQLLLILPHETEKGKPSKGYSAKQIRWYWSIHKIIPACQPGFLLVFSHLLKSLNISDLLKTMRISQRPGNKRVSRMPACSSGHLRLSTLPATFTIQWVVEVEYQDSYNRTWSHSRSPSRCQGYLLCQLHFLWQEEGPRNSSLPIVENDNCPTFSLKSFPSIVQSLWALRKSPASAADGSRPSPRYLIDFHT